MSKASVLKTASSRTTSPKATFLKKASILLACFALALSVCALSGCSFNKDYTPEKSEQKIDNSLLHTPGVLRVGVNTSNAPYAAEAQGAIVGVDVDIAAALADELGLTLELVDVGSNPDTAFNNEDVDIVMGVKSGTTNCWTSKPYLSSSIVLFSLEDDAKVPGPTDVFTVGAQASSMSSVEVSSRLGEDNLETTGDIQSAFELLESGQVNYVATDSTIGSYVAHTAGITVYPIALLSDDTQYCIGVPTTASALQDAITDALRSVVDGGVIAVICDKWLGTQIDTATLTVIEPIPEPETEEGAEGADGSNETDDSSN